MFRSHGFIVSSLIFDSVPMSFRETIREFGRLLEEKTVYERRIVV